MMPMVSGQPFILLQMFIQWFCNSNVIWCHDNCCLYIIYIILDLPVPTNVIFSPPITRQDSRFPGQSQGRIVLFSTNQAPPRHLKLPSLCARSRDTRLNLPYSSCKHIFLVEVTPRTCPGWLSGQGSKSV